MAVLQGFVGSSNRARSLTVNAERTLNWFEAAADGTPKAPRWLCPRPGLRPWTILSAGPVRALFPLNGRAWAVGGNTLYEVFANNNISAYAPTLLADGRNASIAANGQGGIAGNQLAITSGGHLYNLDLATNTLTDVGVDFPAGMVACVGGYMVANVRNTNIFRRSDFEDNTVWNALNFSQIQDSSDLIQSVYNIHGLLGINGSQTSQVWANTGATNVFEPIQGSLMQQGAASEFSFAVVDNSAFWLSQNDIGTGIVLKGAGPGGGAQRISDYAVESALAQAATLTDTIGWAYQQEGHPFYGLYVPSMDTTWCYDIGLNVWHERSHWDPVFERDRPFRARCAMFAFGRNLVGDPLSGALYEQSFDFATDWLV